MDKIIGWQVICVLLALYILYMNFTWRQNVEAQARDMEATECYKLFLNNSDMFGNLIGGNNSTPTQTLNWTFKTP